MRLFNTLMVFITASIIFSGCGNGNSQSNQNTNDSEQNPADISGEGKAEFSFKAKEKDLGKIQKGETVVKGFIFKNTGNQPLVIKEASASCGCTVPEYSEDPVPPGETGFVDVAYDSDGKSAKSFEQTVSLKANTKEGEHEIAITGKVIDNNSRQQQAKQPSQSSPGQTIDLGQNASQGRSTGNQGSDKFGRGPNHPHYQHDHPPQNQQQKRQGSQQQPQNQGQKDDNNQAADQYGRAPGHPHYQHNHPPQNQQQQGDQEKEIQLKQENVEEGEEDQYGRGPEHEHYRHNHPPKDQDNSGGN